MPTHLLHQDQTEARATTTVTVLTLSGGKFLNNNYPSSLNNLLEAELERGL
jgi:hypothetical protein